MAIVGSKWSSRLNARWAYVYSACLHGVFSAICGWTYSTWAVYTENYPVSIDSETKKHIFCFEPNRALCVAYLFAFITFIVTALMIFVALSYCDLNKNSRMVAEKTLKMQRTLLWNLIVLSGVPIFMGGIPFLLIALGLVEHQLWFAQLMLIGGIPIIIGYGAVMCVACLLMFKVHREAVLSAVGKRAKVTSTSSTTRLFAVRNVS